MSGGSFIMIFSRFISAACMGPACRVQLAGASSDFARRRRHFPLPPFHRFKAIRHEDRKTFAIRLLGFAEQEIRLVYAINHAIPWHGCAGDFCEGCVGVDLVDYLVTDTASWNFAGPTDDERHSQRTFHVREVVTAPWPG